MVEAEQRREEGGEKEERMDNIVLLDRDKNESFWEKTEYWKWFPNTYYDCMDYTVLVHSQNIHLVLTEGIIVPIL